MEYRRKPVELEVTKAVEWTGNNLEEVKALLKDCFVEVADEKLRYKQHKNSILITWANLGEMIWLDDFEEFNSTSKEKFLADWELIDR